MIVFAIMIVMIQNYHDGSNYHDDHRADRHHDSRDEIVMTVLAVMSVIKF